LERHRRIQPSRTVLLGNPMKSDGEDVLSTTLLKDESPGTDTGTKVRIVRPGVEGRSSAAAEENDERMACRIRTGAKTLPDALDLRSRFEDASLLHRQDSLLSGVECFIIAVDTMETLTCFFCKNSYPLDLYRTLCPVCHEPLLYDMPKKEKKFRLKKDHPLEAMLDFLPLASVDRGLSLDEGNTPLTRLRSIEKKFGFPQLFAKNETTNPTHSFKDRGTAVAVQKAMSLGCKRIGTVSTGNMAASTAAYGARAGLETIVLAKEDTPEEKLVPSAIHHPLLIKVDGDYGALFRKSLSLAPAVDIYFANSVDPFRIEGYKITGFEVFFQFDRHSPDFLIAPVSAGGHMVGLIRAFQDLKEQGYARKYPHFVGVQAEGCAPIARSFAKGGLKVKRITKSKTVAHAISNPDPPGGNLLLQMIRRSGGEILSVPDDKILEAQILLAELEGLFVQPASAAALAGLLELSRRRNKPNSGSKVVIVLTGSGLKASSSVSQLSLKILRSGLLELPRILKSEPVFKAAADRQKENA
jgi:threonine synthase